MRYILIAVGLVGFAACTAEEPMMEEVTETEEVAAEAAETAAPAPAPAPRATAPAPAPAPRATAPAPAPAPAPPPVRVYEVAAGTPLTFTLIDSLSSETSEPGQIFQASLTDALVVDGQVLAPKNALATGHVVAVQKPGRVSGLARIEVVMTGLEVNGQTVPIQTASFVAESEPTKGEDAAKIGAGAGIGAAIGAALGGGKGAALGAAIGGGGGTAVVLATEGDQIELPSESRLSFELSETLRVSGTS
jgi:hypothetical protein